MMQTARAILLPFALCALLAPARSQEWSDEQLMAESKGFDTDDFLARQRQVAALLSRKEQAVAAVTARIHGDHREYMLRVDRLLAELTDARWSLREQAERTLVEIGARAQSTIAERAEKASVLEERMRCRRILDAIRAKGTADEEKQLRYLRGFLLLASHMDASPKLLRALRSALGHTDPSIIDGAIRALGSLGGNEEADAVFQLLAWKGGVHRARVLDSLARMRAPRAAELLASLVRDGSLSRAEQCAALASCSARPECAPALDAMAASADAIVAAAAKLRLPTADKSSASSVSAAIVVNGGEPIRGAMIGLDGGGTLLAGAFDGIPRSRIEFADCSVIEFPDCQVQPIQVARVFLTQGSLLTGELLAFDDKEVRLRSASLGELRLDRASVQGIALDPTVDRLVGSSVECDRVRLKNAEFVDGAIRRVAADGVVVATAQGDRSIAMAEIAGLLVQRPRAVEPDTTTYARLDLQNGDRLLCFVVACSQDHIAAIVPGVGSIVHPLRSVSRIEVGVGGGAMWGFTLIADYSDNKILEVDDQGRVTFELEDMFGAADVECLDNNNLLVTEFSVSRVTEVNRKGEVVWVYDDRRLKNPFDADRLPNGNTLIADAYGARVIEVSPDKQIVWSYEKEVRPFDVDRLPNGNTLICDVLRDRVIEVTKQGEIVWEAKGMNSAHDADRLPNGNTLVTLRSKGSVVELDRDGKVIWEITGLVSPSDADRLPNGNTVVAEKDQVREFDRRKNVTWRKEVNWAIEANRY